MAVVLRKQALLILFLLFAMVCQAQTVYKTRTGAKYHVQTCRYLKSSFETTVAEAQAEGLTACSVCKPSAGAAGGAVAPTSSYQSTNVSSSSSSGSRQCSGTTKAGARCKRMTTSSNGRCYQH